MKFTDKLRMLLKIINMVRRGFQCPFFTAKGELNFVVLR